MRISQSPEQVQRELANLDDKESDRRESAMEVLKSHVKVLDSKSIPLFLSQVSSTTKLKTAPLSALLRISLCEFVVRVHRLKIVRFIDTIITTIINTLAMASSDTQGSFLVQLACFKVVRAIVKYGIERTTSPVNKMRIIKSLCDPLCDSLSGFSSPKVPSNIDCLGSGAALCLRAVVDSDHWRIASDNMVTMVCIYVDAALRRCPNQTNAYMSLITALVKRNAIVVQNYVWDFTVVGLRILNDGVAEENCEKRLWAIWMIYFLMKYVYPWRYDSQLQLIIEEMELRYFDGMDYVREAAFEACNILRKTPRMLVRSPSLNASLDVDGDDELVSSTNDLPGDSTSDLPGHSNVRVCSPKQLLWEFGLGYLIKVTILSQLNALVISFDRFILIVVCQVNFVLKLVEKDSMEDYERRRKP
ncbi:hypothetical protein FNV43_RR12793 [Rhamnella rubrinervis]|uniref:Uncharacterized protein n=1 Tax=Rhamnella rubrinervis TaxID=2594499 RepID=A0A8K0MIU0_9ROSA|nr:hypothetical protein FNV43_RR12793 [Rhamnella rubrinervis]